MPRQFGVMLQQCQSSKMKQLPLEIKQEVEDDPYYFVMQGGSDGTFAHHEFLLDYGQYMPEISNLCS